MAKKKDIKEKDDSLMEQIQAMEQKAREEGMAKAQKVEDKIHFDSWFAIRSKAIPTHHMKEIIKADFNARKINTMETMEAFDKALEKYGVRLS